MRVARKILPKEGIWTVEDFANYLGVRSAVVMEELSDMGVPIIHLGRLYKYKIFRLEDLRIKQKV